MAEHDKANRQDIVVKMTFRTTVAKADKFKRLAKKKELSQDSYFESLINKAR